MATAQQFAGALQGLSQDLGMFAGVAEKRQEDAEAEALQARKEAAQRAFQVALFNARAAQDQQQFEATRADRKAENGQMMDYRNRDLAEQESYHRDALGQAAADRAATRAIERDRLKIEQQNADAATTRANAAASKEKTDKQTGIIGTRLTAVGRLLESYQKQKEAELAKVSSDVTLMGDPKAMEAARARIAAKYDPVIAKRQTEYDRLNAKFGELSGVDMGDAEEASTVGDVVREGTPGSSNPRMTAPPSEAPYTDDNLTLPADPGMPGSSTGKPGYQSAPGPGNTIRSLADIPPGAIAYLRTHPDLLQQFDEKYGPGTGEKILAKPSGGE